MRLRTRLGGWRRVERYSGRGRLLARRDLEGRPIEYQLDVWEQFVGGRGGRYKIEGEIDVDAGISTEVPAELHLEKGITLQVRLLPGGRVIGDSAPVFPKPDSRRP